MHRVNPNTTSNPPRHPSTTQGEQSHINIDMFYKGVHMYRVPRLKRTVPVFLALGVVVAVGGCASGENTASPKAGASDVVVDVGNGEVTPHNMDSVAVMIQAGPTFSDSALKAEGAKAAGEELGVKVEIYWSNLDPATELSNYRTILSSGKYGGVAMQTVTAQLCKTVAKDAIEKQMLVTIFGGPLCATGVESNDELRAPGTITYVDQNNLIDGASTMFDGAAEVLGDEPQKVLLVYGNEGHSTVNAHEAAWETFSADHPDWEVAGKIYTDWTTPGSFSATQNLLQANSDATVVFTTYVDITAGAVKAIEAQGLDEVSVFETSGGTDISIDLLSDGSLTGSVPVFSYDVGYSAVQSLVDAANGETVESFIALPKAAEIGMVSKETVPDLEAALSK
jgi:ABC-type sugar transport system substrate-binding protein